MDPRQLIQSFYDGIWNRHDASLIPQLLHPEFSFRGSLGQMQRGHAGFAAYVDLIHAALDHYQCRVEDVIAENDQAFARVLFTGIHRGNLLGYAPTFRKVEWVGAAVFRFGAGVITDLWVLGDVDGLRRQLARNKRALSEDSEAL